jgi:hypothetical protein
MIYFSDMLVSLRSSNNRPHLNMFFKLFAQCIGCTGFDLQYILSGFDVHLLLLWYALPYIVMCIVSCCVLQFCTISFLRCPLYVFVLCISSCLCCACLRLSCLLHFGSHVHSFDCVVHFFCVLVHWLLIFLCTDFGCAAPQACYVVP